jgi:hypothetical protein
MKILFAPYNIASMPGITANAINELDGHEAKYLNITRHHYFTSNENEIYISRFFEPVSLKQNFIKFLLFQIEDKFIFKAKLFFTLYKYLKWCDAVHWTWNSVLPFNIDLWLVKFLNKKRFIEWVGSDMRVPEVTMKESKWYAKVFNEGYEHRNHESLEKSYSNQMKFAKYGFEPVLVPEMKLYLKKDLFAKVHNTHYRTFEEKVFPNAFYPEIQNNKIIIVHSPTAKFAKGSHYIIPIVQDLQKEYNIEFKLMHGVSRVKVLEAMQTCDIFIDQIILGSYASAAIEAMSFGKPVIAYIMPSVFTQGLPMHCPIVNAHPDNLKEELIKLLNNPELRYEIGRKSRTYVQQTHNAHLLAIDLINIYKS